LLPKTISVCDSHENRGIAASKNALLKAMKDYEYVFILEDDIIPLSPSAIIEYVKASLRTGIEHFSFAHHGPANASGSVGASGWVEFYPNAIGAFCMYTRRAIETVGYLDENFHNAWEHVEHTHRLAKAGLTSPFWWFADVYGSRRWFREIPQAIESSTIRNNPAWRRHRSRRTRQGGLLRQSGEPSTARGLSCRAGVAPVGTWPVRAPAGETTTNPPVTLPHGGVTCMNVPLTGNSLATAKRVRTVSDTRQTPSADCESADEPPGDVHLAPPSVAANASSWRGVAPCNPARAWKSPAIAGADSATPKAQPSNVVLVLIIDTPPMSMPNSCRGSPRGGPLTPPPFGSF
jgi:hypothetical protein